MQGSGTLRPVGVADNFACWLQMMLLLWQVPSLARYAWIFRGNPRAGEVYVVGDGGGGRSGGAAAPAAPAKAVLVAVFLGMDGRADRGLSPENRTNLHRSLCGAAEAGDGGDLLLTGVWLTRGDRTALQALCLLETASPAL